MYHLIDVLDKKLDGFGLCLFLLLTLVILTATVTKAVEYVAVMFRGWPPPTEVSCDDEEDEEALNAS